MIYLIRFIEILVNIHPKDCNSDTVEETAYPCLLSHCTRVKL